jgi:ATP-GRASP peptide maturase of grasp-with-spasm system
MVCIMSNIGDRTTIEVMKWIRQSGGSVVRIDGELPTEIFEVEISTEAVNISIKSASGKVVRLDEISSFWYRRGLIAAPVIANLGIDDEYLRFETARFLKEENGVLANLLYSELVRKNAIGSFSTRSLNKLKVLVAARNLGIQIPKTLITSKGARVKDFNDQVITKAIYEGFKIDVKGLGFTTYTEKIVPSEIENLSFFPSLFQERIEKEADIRSFFLKGKFYNMAIRSQDHAQTQTDFRKYLIEKGNRCFPFKLPTDLEAKLTMLFRDIELNCGSIDLILTKDSNFVFLEINPVGQFGMVSVPCNYFLEREVAKFLSLNN